MKMINIKKTLHKKKINRNYFIIIIILIFLQRIINEDDGTPTGSGEMNFN